MIRGRTPAPIYWQQPLSPNSSLPTLINAPQPPNPHTLRQYIPEEHLSIPEERKNYGSFQLLLLLETFIIFVENMTSKIEDIGRLFQKRRKELGITQAQLGERCGVTKSEISKIEHGRPITFSTINKLSEALGVSAEIALRPNIPVSSDMIHFVVMSMGLFARQYNLTKKEACNYLSRFKGLRFSIDNYEAEHQLSLRDCVEDMYAVCKRNGGEAV